MQSQMRPVERPQSSPPRATDADACLLPFPPSQPASQRHIFDADPEPTCGQLVDLYLCVKGPKWTPDTLRGRRAILEAFRASAAAEDGPTFGALRPSQLRPSDLESWVASRPQWRKQNSRWGAALAVKALLNWAVKDLRIVRNPFVGSDVELGDRRRATTPEEYRGLLRGGTPRFRQVVVFLRFAACRPQDVRSIRWEWVDWARDRVVIPAAAHKTGRKTRKSKVVYLLPAARRLLAWLRRRNPEATGPCFVNGKCGSAWSRSALGGQLKTARRRGRVAKEATLHGLRHLFATEWIERGGSLKMLSEYLGHCGSQVTERYYVHGEQLGGAILEEAQRLMGKGRK